MSKITKEKEMSSSSSSLVLRFPSKPDLAPVAMFKFISIKGKCCEGGKIVSSVNAAVFPLFAEIGVKLLPFSSLHDEDQKMFNSYFNQTCIEKGVSLWAELKQPILFDKELSEEEKAKIVETKEDNTIFPKVRELTFVLKKEEEGIDVKQLTPKENRFFEYVKGTLHKNFFPNVEKTKVIPSKEAKIWS